ncbi:MAG: glycosyl transferase family 2 [Candidatus Marinimicrobia bacterium]|nr:glycosyl transferase family 2 [Candidatus Neomarinimicrobiota bacterium]
MVDISVVIVNYNTQNYLKECVESIYNCGFNLSKLQIIVVDNFSRDTSILNLKEYISKNRDFTDLDIVVNDSNLGFSKAINIGLSRCNGKYVCILNPDTFVKKDCFTNMKSYLDLNPNIGCATAKVLNSDNSLQISCKRSLPGIVNSFYKIIGLDKLFPNNKHIGSFNLLYLDEYAIHKVEVISGAFMFLRSETIKRVGLFDESFFMYCEDTDYCLRMNKQGIEVYYYPFAEVVHYRGKSANSHPFKVIGYFHDSMFKYYKKHRYENRLWREVSFLIMLSIKVKKYVSYFHLMIKRILKRYE